LLLDLLLVICSVRALYINGADCTGQSRGLVICLALQISLAHKRAVTKAL